MERLKTFGPAGYAEFLVKKTLFNYNDGTFGWGGEGDFSNWVCQDVNTKASPLLKSIYYHQETNHHYLATFFQGVWLLILAVACWQGARCAGSLERPRKKWPSCSSPSSG